MLPVSIILTIAVLTVFFVYLLVLKYAVTHTFVRTRLIMTSFFFFIVVTLTISFWHYTVATLPYTIPAALIGVGLGYLIGVREAEMRLRMEGLSHYMRHFAHIHLKDLETFNWWAIVNFYSIGGALVLINLVGLSSVIFGGSEQWAILTSAVGAFLLGTLVPYLLHLWTIRTPHHSSSSTSEA